MLQPTQNPRSNGAPPHDPLPHHRLIRWSARAVLLTFLLAGFILVYGSQTFGRGFAAAPLQPAVPGGTNPGLTDPNSSQAKDQMTGRYGQELYLTEHSLDSNPSSDSSNSAATDQAWVQSLGQARPAAERVAAIAALTQAPASAVPTLLNALSNPDPGVRQGAAQVLGARGTPEAEDSLFFASFDSNPTVRAGAAAALGSVGFAYVVPRLQWLQTVETDPDVRLAARLAEHQVYARVANTMGLQTGDLRVMAVAPSNERVYGATATDLYAPNGSTWKRIGSVPDLPTALAASGQVLYLGTATRGVFRSEDGGATWRAVDAGLPIATGFAVTALTVNPDDDRQVYVTLAARMGATISPLMPFGLFATASAGDEWQPLAKWNVDDITTRLVIDRNAPANLYGLTEAGTWQYPLSISAGNAPQ